MTPGHGTTSLAYIRKHTIWLKDDKTNNGGLACKHVFFEEKGEIYARRKVIHSSTWQLLFNIHRTNTEFT